MLAAIFFTSFSLIGFEITLSRILSVLLSYHYVFVVLSLALLGLGLGGIFIHFFNRSLSLAFFACLFSLTISLSVIFITQIGSMVHLLFYCFILFIPFFFAGVLLAKVYRMFSVISSKIYGVDLVGAAAGSLGIIPFLNIFGGVETGLLLGVVASMAGLFFVIGRLRRYNKEWILSTVSFLIPSALFGANLFGFCQLDIPIGANPTKEIHDVLYGISARGKIIETRWSAFGRTDLVAFGNNGDHMDLYIDGTAGSPMYRFDGNLKDPAPAIKSLKEGFPGYFPFLYLKEEEKDNALIIGPGGGRDVLLALMGGVRKIAAVDINRDLVEIVQKFSGYNGGIYTDFDHVDIVVGEGRHFLKRQKERFDIIMLSLPVTNSSRSLEGYALTENFLFTTASIHDYLDHLTEEGQLIVIGHNDAEILRLLSISLVALNKRGISHAAAMNQIYILGSDLYPVFVLKKKALDPKEIFLRYQTLHQYKLDPLSSYFPYIRQPGELNPALMALGSGQMSLNQLKELVSRRGFDISPVTDNSPFFYKIEKGLPNSVSLGFWLSAAMLLLIVGIPLLYKSKPFLHPLMKSILLFSMIGMGFMVIEISFIQRFGLFLGQPVLSLGVLLFSLLSGVGIGSLWSGRFHSDKIKRWIAIPSLSIVIMVLSYVFLLPILFNLFLGQNLAVRIFVTLFLLVPMGFLMGFPFPLGIRFLKEKGLENQIPWMWGVNGVSSVFGSGLTIVVAIGFGFTEALLLSACCYFIIFFIFLKP